MLTPVQQRAILYNLPNLVADLDVFDVMDHLIATTPTCLTPTDYETISTTAHQKGRAAGVRCLVTCLLRRPFDSPVFAAFCSALRERYGHLAELLERSLQQPAAVECPVPDSHKQPTKSTSMRSRKRMCSVPTPCQNLADFSILRNLVSLGFSNSVYDIIVSIITIVSSHPLIVLRWNNLSRELGLTETMLQQIGQTDTSRNAPPPPPAPVGHYPQVASFCRYALCLFFTVGISRVLECHGSPFKRTSSALQQGGTHVASTAKRLVERDLIPALERIDCWRLAATVRRFSSLLTESGRTAETSEVDENHDPCALRSCWTKLEDGPDQRLLDQLDDAEDMLRSCTTPLFNHSLINLNWPLVLRELQVCSVCILCLLHGTCSEPVASDDLEEEPGPTGESNPTTCLPLRVCEQALNTYLHVTLRNAMYQQERLLGKSSGSVLGAPSELVGSRICRASVASVVHTKLLPVLRNLGLNALSDEMEQIALEVLH